MLKLPSGFANQPSYAPVMLCPASSAGSNGKDWLCDRPTAQSAKPKPARQDALRMMAGNFIEACDRSWGASIASSPPSVNSGLLIQAGSGPRCFVLRGPFLIVFIAHVGDVHPGVRHFVYS